MKEPAENILAFDTALNGVSVAVQREDGQLFSRQVETQRDQAKLLVPVIQQVLEDAGRSFNDLNTILCTAGPGSFTGLRIGISTARSLALALNIPVYGISTFDMFFQNYIHLDQYDTDKDVVILLETKRMDYYLQIYDRTGEKISAPACAEFYGLQSMLGDVSYLIGGDAVSRFQTEFENSGEDNADLIFLPEIKLPEARFMIASYLLEGGAMPCEPVYLRGADVSKPKIPVRKIQQ